MIWGIFTRNALQAIRAHFQTFSGAFGKHGINTIYHGGGETTPAPLFLLRRRNRKGGKNDIRILYHDRPAEQNKQNIDGGANSYKRNVERKRFDISARVHNEL